MSSFNTFEVVHPQERIYNLIPREEVHIEKSQRYSLSKFRPTVVREKKITNPTMKTMGPAKVEVPSPDKYLKKHSKEPKLPESEGSYPRFEKPPVPTRTDHPTMGIHTKRDFIRTTTVVPKKPQPISVDTNRGHKQPLENSGLVPKYIKKKDYGEVPVYLQQRNEEQQRAQEAYDSYVREQKEQGAMKQLSDEERQSILERLKANWDKLHHEYQSLSLVTDMLSKKAHKERLEAAMKQLETDIEFFERFKILYVPNK
uniref:Enkurin, TRPC channel interacting protein n=1 Tax=Sphaeramia orbicularis TaxID=375764 RepID=A0A672ZGU2_9TELE